MPPNESWGVCVFSPERSRRVSCCQFRAESRNGFGKRCLIFFMNPASNIYLASLASHSFTLFLYCAFMDAGLVQFGIDYKNKTVRSCLYLHVDIMRTDPAKLQ
jgi:hypothetical protein